MQIAAMLGDLAIRMQRQTDSQSTLRTIMAAAATIVRGINGAGISLVQGKTVTSTAATDDVAQTLDLLQGQFGEGPAIDALTHQHTVTLPDLGAEDLFPRFTDAAIAHGVHAIAAFRLFVDRGALGVLTLYGTQPHVFDDDAILYGEILAQHAAVAMAGAQAEEQLQRAIASRDTIGQAKGVIMERFHVDAVRAFELLTRLSQDSNTKLLQVAVEVITTAADPQQTTTQVPADDTNTPQAP